MVIYAKRMEQLGISLFLLTPQQNGIIERMNWTMLDKVQFMMLSFCVEVILGRNCYDCLLFSRDVTFYDAKILYLKIESELVSEEEWDKEREIS